MRSRLNNIITNLNLMDQMFDNQTTINNLQTAYDICLNARYTYEFWLTDQFRFVDCSYSGRNFAFLEFREKNCKVTISFNFIHIPIFHVVLPEFIKKSSLLTIKFLQNTQKIEKKWGKPSKMAFAKFALNISRNNISHYIVRNSHFAKFLSIVIVISNI